MPAVLMAAPSASARLVSRINNAAPSFSAATRSLFDATTRSIDWVMDAPKLMSFTCRSSRW